MDLVQNRFLNGKIWRCFQTWNILHAVHSPGDHQTREVTSIGLGLGLGFCGRFCSCFAILEKWHAVPPVPLFLYTGPPRSVWRLYNTQQYYVLRFLSARFSDLRTRRGYLMRLEIINFLGEEPSSEIGRLIRHRPRWYGAPADGKRFRSVERSPIPPLRGKKNRRLEARADCANARWENFFE